MPNTPKQPPPDDPPSPAHDPHPADPASTRHALFARLATLGITTTTKDHAAVFTVAESKDLQKTLPGAHTKNLLLKDAKGRLFLVIAQAETEIHLKTLHKKIGAARLSFAKPEILQATLKLTPGSVTAFGLMNDPDHKVQVIIDANLMDHALINCHPMENTATTTIQRNDLLDFIADCGHTPHITKLEATATDESGQ